MTCKVLVSLQFVSDHLDFVRFISVCNFGYLCFSDIKICCENRISLSDLLYITLIRMSFFCFWMHINLSHELFAGSSTPENSQLMTKRQRTTTLREALFFIWSLLLEVVLVFSEKLGSFSSPEFYLFYDLQFGLLSGLDQFTNNLFNIGSYINIFI